MQPSFERAFVLKLVLLIESAVLLISAIWCLLSQRDLLPLFVVKQPWHLGLAVAAGLMTSTSSLFISYLGKKMADKITWLHNYCQLVENVMAPVFAKATLSDIFLISLSSGFCEEVFYRGILQFQFGIIAASLIFGFCHYAGPRYFFYVIWAGIVGAFFGGLIIITDCIWVPIIAHMVSNFLSLCILRYKIARNPVDEKQD